MCSVIQEHISKSPLYWPAPASSSRSVPTSVPFPWPNFSNCELVVNFNIPCIQTAWSKISILSFPPWRIPAFQYDYAFKYSIQPLKWLKILDHRSKIPAKFIDSNSYPLGGRHEVFTQCIYFSTSPVACWSFQSLLVDLVWVSSGINGFTLPYFSGKSPTGSYDKVWLHR